MGCHLLSASPVYILSTMSVQAMVAPHMADLHWGAHASAMINGAMFRQPPGGGHDDKYARFCHLREP